jgi:hypothetical protein
LPCPFYKSSSRKPAAKTVDRLHFDRSARTHPISLISLLVAKEFVFMLCNLLFLQSNLRTSSVVFCIVFVDERTRQFWWSSREGNFEAYDTLNHMKI